MRLNLKWEELAYKIGISVAMLGFLRRGERRPTTKILAAIAALETDTKTTTERQPLQLNATNDLRTQTLETENRRLKEENASLRGEIRGLQFAIERMMAEKRNPH